MNNLRAGLILAATVAALLVASGWRGHASAQDQTPAGCHWAPAYGNPQVSELWCPGSDGRMRSTGQTQQFQKSDYTDGCPDGQYYNGRGCVTDRRSSSVTSANTAPASGDAAPAQGGALTGLAASLDRLVELDSRSWLIRTYDSGSITNVKVLSSSRHGKSATVYGEYTYSGGSPGWVKAELKDGDFTCVEFWDFPGRCRAVGDPDSRKVAAAAIGLAIVAVAAGGSSSGGSSDSGSRTVVYRGQQQQSEPDYGPPPAPVEPIGGEGGLYGSNHSCC